MDDVRWKQRFESFLPSLGLLDRAVNLMTTRQITELEELGLIQAFELTHELAWKVLKDYLKDQGHVGLSGSKDSTREAFKQELLENGEAWMDMIEARNITVHPYDEAKVDALAKKIYGQYHAAFHQLASGLGGKL